MPGTLQVGGNTVLTHTGDAGAGTNTINNAVVFPAGHTIQSVIYAATTSGQTGDDHLYLKSTGWTTSSTGSHLTSITKRSNNSIFLCTMTGPFWTGNWNYSAQENFTVHFRTSDSSDMSSNQFTKYVWQNNWDTRGGGDPPQQFGQTPFIMGVFTNYQTSAVGTTVYFDVKRSRDYAVVGFQNYFDTIFRIEEIQS